MTVVVSRDEGIVTKQGTVFNASTLNKIINDNSYGIDFLFKSFYTAEDDLKVEWVQKPEVPNTKRLRIDLTQKFYGKLARYDDLKLLGDIIQGENFIEVVLIETDELNRTTGSSTKVFPFYVELYLDNKFTQYLTKIVGSVSYTNTSMSPLD